jgi:peptidoglycan/LPS O-acetylase OafA/YrhL
VGSVRLFLAAVVAVRHFRVYILKPIDAPASDILDLVTVGFDASHAVIFFYVISGFLISYALENKYATNIAAFYTSRFIRIFPLYWALYGGMLILDYGGARPDIANASIAEWLPGFVLFGSDWAISFLHYPTTYWGEFPPFLRPAWSLGAELTFYLLAPWLLWRFPKLCLVALAASAAVRGVSVSRFGFDETWSFHFFPSTLMFFLLGHYSRLLYRWAGHRLGAVNYLWLAAFFGLHVYNYETPQPFDGPFFYGALAAFVLALPFLFERTKDSRVLNFLGDLSYPLYLSHLTTMSLMAFVPALEPAVHGTGQPQLFLSLPIQPRFLLYTLLFLASCLVTSALLHKCVETPLAALCGWVFRRRIWVPAPVPAA